VFLCEHASPLDLAEAVQHARCAGLLAPADPVELLPADPFHEGVWARTAAALDLRAALLRVHLGAAGGDDLVEVVAPPAAGPDALVREPRPAYGSAPVGRLLALEMESPTREPATVARQIGLIGTDPAFLRECEKAAAVAPHSVPLLIRGETGTGKGLLARYVHELSPRARQPFVAVNCSALPEQLAESLLFGHVQRRLHRRGGRPAGQVRAAPTAERCSWTRSANCRPPCSPSCCACWRTAGSNRWAPSAPAGWTCGSWRRRTATSKPRWPSRIS
jgi:hypothetical protein